MSLPVEKVKGNVAGPSGSTSYTMKNDSGTKLLGEDETRSDGEDTIPSKSPLKESSFYFEGVRFSPKVIEFVDAYEGKQFSEKMTIQNVGKNPVFVRIGEPNAFIFQLKKPSRRVKLLAAGCSITRTVTYSYHNNDLVQRSQIPVQINGNLFDYPIAVIKAKAEIEVQPTKLDFQAINLGAQAKKMSFTLYNSGTKRTRFQIDVSKNDIHLMVNPTRGTIRPKTRLDILVAVMGINEGAYYKELWVTTNEMSIQLPILVEVVKPRMEIVHVNGTKDFTLIDFQPTFIGTQRIESFVLKNASAEATLFNVLAEVNGGLQFLVEARKFHETFNMFHLMSEEGRLEPFESRILTVINYKVLDRPKALDALEVVELEVGTNGKLCATSVSFSRILNFVGQLQLLLPSCCVNKTKVFKPKRISVEKGWHHKENEKAGKNHWEHIVFFRINKVQCTEANEMLKIEGAPVSIASRERSLSILQTEASVTTFSPSMKSHRMLAYGPEITEGDTSGRRNSAVLLGEEESILRLCLHGKAIEPDVIIQPTELGFQSYVEVGRTDKKVLRVTNNSILPLKFRYSKTMNVNILPKEGWLGPGKAIELLVKITPTCPGSFSPKIKLEFLSKSDVVFEEDKNLIVVLVASVPLKYCAIVETSFPTPKIGFGISPDGMDEVGFLKELVTFKSDYKKPYAAMLLSQEENMRPSWMKKEPDQMGKVDNAMIAFPNDMPRMYYSWPQERICRTIFKGFFRYSPPTDTTYSLRPLEKCFSRLHRAFWDQYLAFLADLRQAKYPNLRELEECQSKYDKCCDRLRIDIPQSESPIDNSEVLEKMTQKKKNLHLLQALVPLSPMHLSNISVEPKFIDFRTVALNTLVQETLSITNRNPFYISIRFVSKNNGLSVPEKATVIFPPNETKTLQVFLQTKELGQYHGFLTYVINGSHEFNVATSAYVTAKTLVLDSSELILEFGNFPPENAFQPRSVFLSLGNPVQIPIRYFWKFPPESAYETDIIEGEVPPRSKLLVELIFVIGPRKSYFTELSLISESGAVDLIKLICPTKKISVDFITNKIDMKDVPLNLTTKVSPIIHNGCFHDVSFEVMEYSPMPGVIVEPRQGVLKSQSFFPLSVKVKIPVVMKFSFDVILIVHFTTKISVKITGHVVMPNIRIRPSEVVMRPICAQSFNLVAVWVENAGNTFVRLSIDLKGCPDYKILEDSTKINLPPKNSKKLIIQHLPEDVARYVFYLPIIVNDILGPPVMQEPDTEFLSFYISNLEENYKEFGEVLETDSSNLKIPSVSISCQVSPSLLKISPLNINFGLKPKSLTEFQTYKVTISNYHENLVTFCIRDDDLGNESENPFFLKPTNVKKVEYRSKSMKASLKKGENMVFEASFQPKKAGSYSAEIPVFIRGYNDGYVFNYITMKGELKKQSLTPDTTEVHFPPLPLDVGCDAIITIRAENYRSGDTLSCVIWDSQEGNESLYSNSLYVHWMDEPKITNFCGPQTFRVKINFRSFVTVALRNYLLFTDSTGEHCTVLVTAIADNSAVSTHAFLTTRSSRYKLVRDTLPGEREFEADKEEDALSVAFLGVKTSKRIRSKAFKKERRKSGFSENSDVQNVHNSCLALIDKGPRLVIQVSKSMTRPTQLDFVNLAKNQAEIKSKNSSATVISSNKSKTFISPMSSYTGARTLSYVPQYKVQDGANDVTHPNFPANETLYGKHFRKTLAYVERWVYEVGMKCNEYFAIPTSFQHLIWGSKSGPKDKTKGKTEETRIRKDFLDFLQNVVSSSVKNSIPKRVNLEQITCLCTRAEHQRNFFAELLKFLVLQGCLLPHVRPEHLLDYDDYVLITETHELIEVFQWDNVKSNTKTKIETEEIPRETSSEINPTVSSKDSLLGTLKTVSDAELVQEEDNPDNDAYMAQMDTTRLLVEGRKFSFQTEVLDRVTFEARSTQAWLDVVIQVFRIFILTRVVYKATISSIAVVGMNDRLLAEDVDSNFDNFCKSANTNYLESLDSNIYTVQERILLTWLNRHFNFQKDVLWRDKKEEFMASPRVVNNFDRDLADSLALITVTAAHCPYIANEFSDVFTNADTLNKMYHNAAKLISVLRKFSVGLTIEAGDIVQPNPVFMVMLVTQLYEVLPRLYPRSLICFSAPLASELTRTIQLKNKSPHVIFYEATFIGEHEGYFRLKNSAQLIEVKPSKSTDIHVIFTARKIKKVSATLVLCGGVVSPNFGKDISFNLEGQPSALLEVEKFELEAQLYKVICLEIPVKPPYVEATTYEIWHTTKQPEYIEYTDISLSVKPWSKIKNRKVSRRLFLNQSEMSIGENEKSSSVSVTVSCLTEQTRSFWLLFRSHFVGDFIILIEIRTSPKLIMTSIDGFYSDFWSKSSECVCPDGGKTLKTVSSKSTNCPLLTQIGIPVRNEPLWEALKTMFLKTLGPEEIAFWSEHFELNIGICLILWLVDVEEDEAIVDEFVHLLQTQVTYRLNVEPPENKHVSIPETIDIPDVRARTDFRLPIHIGKNAPSDLKLKLTMTSENGKETRKFLVLLSPPEIKVDSDGRHEENNFQLVCGPIEMKGPCGSKRRKKTKQSQNKNSKQKIFL